MTYRSDTSQPQEFLQMESYWQALRGTDGAIPQRAQFDPRGISQLLGSTLLLERIAPGEVRIRLAGMALHELMGMELRGMPLSALAVPTSRLGLAERVERVFQGPSIARLVLSGEPGFARPSFGAKLLLLPMIGPSGLVDRALGALICSGPLGRAPRRLVLEGGQVERVSGLPNPVGQPTEAPRPRGRGLDSLSGALAPSDLAQPGLAETAAEFDAAKPRRHPHLRLVKG